MSDHQIVAGTGGTITLAEVRRLSLLESWDTVSVLHMREFLGACNLDLTDRAQWRNAKRYMKKPKFEHLRRHHDWPHFRELLAVYAETLRR